jgi:hypothetical protein
MSYTDPYPRGRRVSWVAVAIITAGFIIGGLGLILGPAWWLFWTGLVLAGIGGILALVTDIFSDVETDHAHGPSHVTRRQQARVGQRDPQVDRRVDDPYAQQAGDDVARGEADR